MANGATRDMNFRVRNHEIVAVEPSWYLVLSTQDTILSDSHQQKKCWDGVYSLCLQRNFSIKQLGHFSIQLEPIRHRTRTQGYHHARIDRFTT